MLRESRKLVRVVNSENSSRLQNRQTLIRLRQKKRKSLMLPKSNLPLRRSREWRMLTMLNHY